ncbi:MAG: hypothetical protein VW230_02370 [Candidatus Poseidoniales archaeon]
MIELRMEQCLKEVLGYPKQNRLKIAVRSSSWELLDKPHKGILSFAMNEEEVPPEDDEKGSTSQPVRSRGRRLRNKSRGQASAMSPFEYLPELDDMEQFELSSASTLAILLIRKQMNDQQWNDDFDALEQVMRNDCLEKGVHPVWHMIAEKTNYLTQFLAFSKVRPKSETATIQFDVTKVAINPTKSSQIVELLTHALATTIDANLQVAMNRLVSQLQSSSGHVSKVEQQLLELSGDHKFLSIVLKFFIQDSLDDDELAFLQGSKSQVAKLLYIYHQFQNKDYSSWKEVIELNGENELQLFLLETLWMNIPDEASELTSGQLEDGIQRIQHISHAKAQTEKIKWWKMSALQKEGEGSVALEVLQDLSISSTTDIDALLKFLTIFPQEETSSWLEKYLDVIDVDGLSAILVSNHYEGGLQLHIAQKIFDTHGLDLEQERSFLLQAFVCGLDFDRLIQLFHLDPVLSMSYPYDALFCYHATPSGLSVNDEKRFHELRLHSIQSLNDSQRPNYLSDATEELLLLMEGIQSESNALMKTLGNKTYIDFLPIINALHHGIAEVNIQQNKLEAVKLRVDNTENLSIIERHLFNVLFATISVNNIRQSFHNRMEDTDQRKVLSSIVNQPYFTLTILHTIQELVLDYDLGIPELVEWYQHWSPSSPWQTLSRAAHHVTRNEQLNAAREYKRIADQIHQVRIQSNQGKQSEEDVSYYIEQGVFGIEQEIALYRKALIHYAHAEHWSEALELLEKNASLKSALTKRFQLYLHVSDLASRQQSGPATRLILNHVQKKQEMADELHDNQRYRETYDEEELETLRSYTTSHAIHLPEKPFNGRVIAAHTELSRKLSRNRDEFERRYQTLAKEKKLDTMAVYSLAKDASQESPLTGLKILERAQHQTNITSKQRDSLQAAELNLFKSYESEIALKNRSQLRQLNLKPLVIIDTNILVNALIEEVYAHLGIIVGHQRSTMKQSDSLGDVLPNSGLGDFFRFLKNQADSGKIFLHVPDVIRDELNMFKDKQRLERQMNLQSMYSKSNGKEITQEFLQQKINEVIASFSTWKSPIEIKAVNDINTPEIEEFFVRHEEVFQEISEVKQKNGATTPRTEIAGKKYYPEENDMQLLHYTKSISELASKDIGVVLIASYDNDFTFISRSLEETFGFSVVRNPRTLSDWL